MPYRHHRWLLRLLALIVIANSTFLEFQVAVKLYKLDLLFLIPLGIVVPVLITYFLLGVKIPDLGTAGEQPTSLYAAVRGDFITIAVLTSVPTAIFILQN